MSYITLNQYIDYSLEPPKKYFCNNEHNQIPVNIDSQLRKSIRPLYKHKYENINVSVIQDILQNNLIVNDARLFYILKKCNLDCIKYFEEHHINFIKEYPIISGKHNLFETQNCLFAFIENNNYDVLEYILNKYHDQININQIIQKDKTPLLKAIIYNKIDYIKLLLNFGARYDMLFGDDKMNLLQYLLFLNNIDFVLPNEIPFKIDFVSYDTLKYIIEHMNFDVNYYNKKGENIIMSALNTKNDKLIQLISDKYINKLQICK